MVRPILSRNLAEKGKRMGRDGRSLSIWPHECHEEEGLRKQAGVADTFQGETLI